MNADSFDPRAHQGAPDEFKGRVGGTPFENVTDGLAYGIQAEAWW